METAVNLISELQRKPTVGEFIRQRRLALGMSQPELGRKIGKYQVWVSQRECGHSPVRNEDVPVLAEALQTDEVALRAMLGTSDRPAEPTSKSLPTAAGVVVEEAVTTHSLRWQAEGGSAQIEELSREGLLTAVRSLFEANEQMRAEFDRATDEIAEMYEQKIRTLHHALAANVELGFREAVRDKLDVILESVMERLHSAADEQKSNGSEEETNNER